MEPKENEAWDLASTVQDTVHYSDLFDYPLRPHEVHRYLLRKRARPDEVFRILSALAHRLDLPLPAL